MKTAIVSVLLCLFLSLGTSTSLADSIIRGGEWGDAAPAVAYNSANHEYLVVWNEFMPVFPFFGPVMGRRLAIDGEKLGAPFKIFDSGVKPSVVYDANNNRYCVVCESNFQTHLCFLDARGKNTGTPLPYADSTFPRIYYNSLDNSFLLLSIHIQENPAGSGNCDRALSAMSIDSNGVAGTRYVIATLSNDTCTSGEYFAAAFAPVDSALTPQGRYLVGVDSVKSPLYMLNRNGERVQVKPNPGGYAIAFKSKSEIPVNMDIAFGYRNGNTGDPVFLVIWGERGNKYFDGEPWTGIYGGVVDADEDDYSGEVNNYTFPISLQWQHLAQRTYAETWNPKASYNPATGRFVVIWRETPGPSPDPRDLAEHSHIRAETLKTLERRWPDGNFLLSKDIAASDPGLPALSVAGPSPLAVWQDNRNAATTMSDIYGSLINVSGKSAHNLSGRARGWVTVSAGSAHSLGIKSDGSLWAWGRNYYGQLGINSYLSKLTPTRVGTWNDWIAVSAGLGHSLGIRSDGSLYAWGTTAPPTTTPSRIGTWNDWIAVSDGGDHSLGIRSNGPLYAWGINDKGQLGTGDNTDKYLPAKASPWDDWKAISAGLFHSLGLRSTGRIYGWGNNFSGQLGLGDTTDRNIPCAIGNRSDWTAISAGSSHGLGLRSTGLLYGWGRNDVGQLGLGNTINRDTPSRVGAWTDWTAVSAGGGYSLGIRADGSLYAWGYNGSGQLGLGDNRNRYVPTLVGRKFPWPMFLPAIINGK